MRVKLFTILFVIIGLVAVTVGYAVNSKLHRVQQPSNRYLPLAQKPEQKSVGGVSGRVVNADGRPVNEAAVYAESYPARMGVLPVALTDRYGNFVIENLEVGRYKLTVEKEEDGYPSTRNRFYAAGFVEPPEVVVYANQTVPWGDIPLGPKAGKIVGSIKDAVTKERMARSIELRLQRADDPANRYSRPPDINGYFEILVPPVPFTIEVTRPGYENKKSEVLRLKKGEVRRFDIALTAAK